MAQFNKSISVFISDTTNQTPFLFNSIELRNLQITFRIEKNEGTDPNTAKVEIYNLSNTTKDSINQIGKNLIVNAGYLDGDGESMVFFGNITSISHRYLRPNVITTIIANDGKSAIDTTKISISRGSGSSAIEILNTILKSFPLPNNLQTININDIKYSNGFSFAGLAKTALTKVTDFLNLSWSIQNNEITIIPFDESNGNEIFLISPTTGLLESPEKISGESRKAKKKSLKNKPGWRIRTLLLPTIIPTDKIRLQSREINKPTDFVVANIVHDGEQEGSNFNSIIVGWKISSIILVLS